MSRCTASRLWLVGVLACLVVAPVLLAQNPTGDLTGRVTDESGAALPGVTVTATSPALQGSRSTVTAGNGTYKLPFLPPGTYSVTYELDEFSTAVREVKISAAQNTNSDIAMQLGAVEESIVVTSQQALISETATAATTITKDELEALPIGRDFQSAVELAPGVSHTGPSTAPSIAGAMSFENLWMINGVVINENIRGSVLPLFIEDAIQETTTAISGVSAEYGRFTGGVVNAITKSGGNQFSGSFRTNFVNDKWIAKNELSPEREDKINETYEATLGGYFMKDHLWFFAAGRDLSTSGNATTNLTLIPYPEAADEQRLEGKLTISPTASHSIIGSYLEIDRSTAGSTFGTVLDLRSVNENREDPQDISAVNYTGILTSNLFIEAQYSDRNYVIGRGSGGVPDLIEGTLFRTRNDPYRFHAPTFCGSCEDEKRDNENLLGKVSYFLDAGKAGTHDLVFGYDTFDDQRFAINHQTGSDFTFYAVDVLRTDSGDIYVDPQGNIIPVINPAAGRSPWLRWFAVFNLDLARPTAFKTNSYFVNDTWRLNKKWTVNLGLRYDENDGRDSSGALVASDSKVGPRLSASWDLKGDGDLVLNASYGTYVAAIANGVADNTSNGGAIGQFTWAYNGPPINTDPNCYKTNSCTNGFDALRTIFAWYDSQGGVYDLSQLDPNAPINNFLVSQDIPGATAKILGTLGSPAADEFTIGVNKRLGNRGLFRADFIYRNWTDFYAERTDTGTGQVQTPNGPADLTVLGNFANNYLDRKYTGLLTQFRYRVNDRVSVAANYTLSETEGNFDGEFSNTGPVTSDFLDYPEYKQATWNIPKGDLRTDQRHKVRAWATYSIIQGPRNRLNVSWLENYFSGQPYGISEFYNFTSFVNNPGYVTPDTSIQYYITPRDAFRTDNVHRSDLSLNYGFVFKAWNRDVEIFLQPEVTNLFNESAIDDPQGNSDGEAVSAGATFNPFTTTPLEGVNYTISPAFGTPSNEDSFQNPRTFRFSVGIRF